MPTSRKNPRGQKPAWGAGPITPKTNKQLEFKAGEGDWLNDGSKVDSPYIKGIFDLNRPGKFKASEETNQLSERTKQPFQKVTHDNPELLDGFDIDKARQWVSSRVPAWPVHIDGKRVDPRTYLQQNKNRKIIFLESEDDEDSLPRSR